MSAFRRLLLHRHLAALTFAAALLMKLVVPGGYMVSNVSGWPTITLCPQVAPMPAAMDGMAHLDMAHPDMAAEHDPSHAGGKGELPCVFTALTAAMVAATDPVLLAALIAFVMALAISGIALPVRAEPVRARPPLRGPPTRL